MRKDDAGSGADEYPDDKGLFVGNGASANYPALLLLLAGGVFGGLAVYDSVRRGSSYAAFLFVGILCALIAIALIMKGGRKK